jgi:hypothetical protein
MHESEWLPWLLSKSDMLYICNEFNLSVDGFRKDRLSSRSDEMLRTLVTEAMKRGIGAKKAARGKILMPMFYAQIAELVIADHPSWSSLDFHELGTQLNLDYDVRPFEKLAVIYELHNDKYIEYVETFQRNVQERNEILYGVVSDVSDSVFIERTIAQLGHEVSYPTQEEYAAFIATCGATERWKEIHRALQEKDADRSRFTWIMGLPTFDKFLALVTMLPKHEALVTPVVYGLYAREKEIRFMDSVFQTQSESAAASELTAKLTKELEAQKEEVKRLNERYALLSDELQKMDDQAETHKKLIVNLEQERDDDRRRRMELEHIKELFDELVPPSKTVVIITDKPDARIKKVFPSSIFSKNYLLKEKQNGNIHNLKTKIWFIDRLSFTNTKEWVQLKIFFTDNGFHYEEYNDYVELLKQYMKVIHNDDEEEYQG